MSTIGPLAAPAAGTHLLADFWGAKAIGSVEELDALVRSAVASAGATLLELAFHQFPAHGAHMLPGGITGYALLAESHISVHTWPERGYVAIDIFMCGEQRPETALEVMRLALAPARARVQTVRRGVEEDAVETRSTTASGHSTPGLPISGFPTSGLTTSELGASEFPAPVSPPNEPPLAVGSE